MEPSHKFDVEGLKRVSSGLDKVNTCMNTIVDDISPVGFILCLKVCVKARFNAFQDGFPT
jgi:hypothetical protein